MVGATRGFITKPLNTRAVVNGIISSIIAIGLLLGFIYLAEQFVPYLKSLHDTMNLIMIFAGIFILGILISLFSTYRSARKYLKMKLDDLY